MGLNLVTICERHKVYNYSMRGEEHIDFQTIMRSKHRECMKDKQVFVICDADETYSNSDSGYEEMWAYEERPHEFGIDFTLEVMK